MRKVITLIGWLCGLAGLSVWRQSSHNFKRLKRLYRKAQNLKRSKAKSEKKRKKREREIVRAHRQYTDVAEKFLEKARMTLPLLRQMGILSSLICDEIERYMGHAERQVDQIRRRVIGGETIPHAEKVFSIFEEHTEWIRKGKAGVPQELGVQVCVMDDQYGVILNHMVMQNTIDKRVAVPFVEQTKSKYPDLGSCSFDRGFYTPQNRIGLGQILDRVVLPKKGKLSQEEQLETDSEEYVGQRRQHSAIESAINALENHGLDRCPDHGIRGFERYVALAVLARNIQNLGNIIFQIKKSKRTEQQKKPYRKAS
jgi:phage gp36-like protein